MLTKCVDQSQGKSKNKRSSRCIMSNEARVLRQMRIERGLSMRAVGDRIGLSDSYIAHIETGRMDPPVGEKLEKILSVYGGIKAKSFYEKARNYKEQVTEKDELQEILERLPEEKISLLLNVAKSLV